MLCNSCSTQIPESARFCPTCGAPIDGVAALARPMVDGFALIRNYIPRALAQKILEAGKLIESERRLVTVLFADVTGFTALSEKLDLEEVSTILNECFTGLIATILKYEGTIDKFIGDGIMAIFGAPLAHENDPERAVRCALDLMVDIEHFNTHSPVKLPIPLGLHVGLHSGLVIAGNVGSDLRMNYSVIGDTVNLASRLVELAPKGEVYLTADTYKLVSNVAVAAGPFPMTLKGKAVPVDVYKLRGLKSQAEALKPAIGVDQFVGREKEIGLFRSAVDAVLKKNQVRVLIRGEAGVGKSRLKAELVKLAYEKGIAAYEGQCSSFEVNTPYYLWTNLLRDLLKITPQTGEQDIRARLHKVVSNLALDEHEPYLAALLSIRYEEILLLDESLRKQRIFQATRALLSAIAVRRPILFILEDLHWIDRFSQELLEYMFSRTTSVVLSLFLLIFRDEYSSAQEMEESSTLIDLNRLGREEAVKLIHLRLEVQSVPRAVEDLILKRSEGNPFFIHEMVKMLLDKKKIVVRKGRVEILSDDLEAGIPETIQGIIMARIDRLQDSIKEVLFSASVIGREFSRPLLEQVVLGNKDLQPSLVELRSLELVLQKDEAEQFDYLFKHFLIQEVAYNTILVHKRRELHGSIARAIEELYADRLMEFYELLAFHYEKAEEWDKAAEYLSRSGHKVSQMYSNEESRGFFERREVAVKKLYQSASARMNVFAMMWGILPPLLAMLVPILPIFMYARLLARHQDAADWVSQLIIGIAVSLVLVWYTIALWYLGVVPFLRGRPKLYDLMEDQVRVIYRDGTTLSIGFDEIASLRYRDQKTSRLRPWRQKLIDPFHRIANYDTLTFGIWLKEVFLNILPPYSFGLGARTGEIVVRLLNGYTVRRIFFPWLNSPLGSRDLGLVPFDARDFYTQLEVAFTKWQRQKR
jgi:class 3 adenylate cyclase